MPVPDATNDSFTDERAAQWERQFAKLVAFKNCHGHCDVPWNWPGDLIFVGWVNSQRMMWTKGQLKPEREQRLLQLGFKKRLRPDAGLVWENRFAQLVAFKARFGHCHVPSNCKENPGLAVWITRQRYRWMRGLLKPERIRRLEELGLNFEMQRRMSFNPWPKLRRHTADSPELKALNRRWRERLAALRNGV